MHFDIISDNKDEEEKVCNFQHIVNHLNLKKDEFKYTMGRPVINNKNYTEVLITTRLYAILDMVICLGILLLLMTINVFFGKCVCGYVFLLMKHMSQHSSTKEQLIIIIIVIITYSGLFLATTRFPVCNLQFLRSVLFHFYLGIFFVLVFSETFI